MNVRQLDRSVYDTKEGIATMLGSYDDLYALSMARREAGYERHERLSEFYVLGRFFAHDCGNWMTVERTKWPPERWQALPPVMTREEFDAYLDENGLEHPGWEGIHGFSRGWVLRPPHAKCARCGGDWTLDDCHDFDNEGAFGDDVEPLDRFAGLTLRQVEVELNKGSTLVTLLNGSVRNDAWMDPEARPESRREEGWRDGHSDPPITMDHVVRPGDEAITLVYRYYHGACYRQLQGEQLEAEQAASIEGIRAIFEESGFEDVKVEKVRIPPHLIAWIMSEEVDLDEDGLQAEIPYLRVSTKQGSVGIFMGPYPALDLEGTGIGIRDLAPDAPYEAAGLPLLPLAPEPGQLLLLRQLMVKKRTEKK